MLQKTNRPTIRGRSTAAFHKPDLERPQGSTLVFDDTQRLAAALLLYIVDMGVDGRLLILASQAGPNEIRWLELPEARDLRVFYEPEGFKPWRIEPYKNGAVAVSQSNDGLRSIVAGCSPKTGPYVALIDKQPQC